MTKCAFVNSVMILLYYSRIVLGSNSLSRIFALRLRSYRTCLRKQVALGFEAKKIVPCPSNAFAGIDNPHLRFDLWFEKPLHVSY